MRFAGRCHARVRVEIAGRVEPHDAASSKLAKDRAAGRRAADKNLRELIALCRSEAELDALMRGSSGDVKLIGAVSTQNLRQLDEHVESRRAMLRADPESCWVSGIGYDSL